MNERDLPRRRKARAKRQQPLPLGRTAGEILRAGREKAGMTRDALSAKMGQTKSAVALVELNVNAPNSRNLAQWCRLVGCSVAEVCDALEARPPCKL